MIRFDLDVGRLLALGLSPADASCSMLNCRAPAALSTTWDDGGRVVLAHCPGHFALFLGPTFAAMRVDALGKLLGAAGVTIRYAQHAPDGGFDLDALDRVMVEAPVRGWSRNAAGHFLPDDRTSTRRGHESGDDLGRSIAMAIAHAQRVAAVACITPEVALTGRVWVVPRSSHDHAADRRRVVDVARHFRHDKWRTDLVVDRPDEPRGECSREGMILAFDGAAP